MLLINARYKSFERLRKWHFLSVEDLYSFCEQMGIGEEEIEIYMVEDTPAGDAAQPAETQSTVTSGEAALDEAEPGPPPYGVWVKWPGFFCTDHQDQPLAFPSVEAAQAWIEAEDYIPSAVQVRSLPTPDSGDGSAGS